MGTPLEFQRGILLLDDFEGAERWVPSGTGSDYSLAFGAVNAFFGDRGMRTQTKATTPADGDQVFGTRYFPVPFRDLVVFRARLRAQSAGSTEWLRVILHVSDGSREYQAGLRWGPSAGPFERLNDTGGWTALAGYTPAGPGTPWYILELQFDMGKKEYVKCLFQGLETDLAGEGIHDVTADTTRWAKVEIGCEASGASRAEIYWDAIYVGEYEKF